MKKLMMIAVFVSVLIPVPGYGQDSTEVDISPENVTPGVSDEIFSRLDAAVDASVEGVKVGAEFTWPILVRQQIAEAAVTVFTLLTGLILLKFMVFPVWAKAKKARLATEDGWMMLAMTITFIVTIMITLSLGDLIIGAAMTQIINPEYHALMDVLNALGINGGS